MSLPHHNPVSKYTFYYTNLAFDYPKLQNAINTIPEFNVNINTMSGTSSAAAASTSRTGNVPIKIFMSNQWQYKFMLVGSGATEDSSDLKKVTNWQNTLLLNFTTEELSDYMHLIVHIGSNYIDERNLNLISNAHSKSLKLLSSEFLYQNESISKYYSPYNLYLDSDTMFSNDNTIYTRDEEDIFYTNGELFNKNKEYEIDTIKCALQRVYSQKHRLVYYSSTRKLNSLFDTLLQEQYRLNFLFNSVDTMSSRTEAIIVHVPNIFTPHLNIKLKKYIQWELYRIERLKTTIKWVPFINTQNLITYKFKQFIGLNKHHFSLNYTCLKTNFDFIIL